MKNASSGIRQNSGPLELQLSTGSLGDFRYGLFSEETMGTKQKTSPLIDNGSATRLLLCCSLLCSLLVYANIVEAEGKNTILDRLDMTREGLESVREAATEGDFERAAEALLVYYRHRTSPRWFSDRRKRPKPNANYRREGAESVLRREYSFVGKRATLTHDIDWNADPLHDHEWPIELNRHYTWVTLGRAYWETHDERYAEDFVFQLRDWLADNPRPDTPRTARWTWRTLECGIRLSGSWPECFHRFLDSPAFTSDVLCAMLNSLWEQADYLTRFHGGGNWLVAELNGLATLSIVFPEFKDAPKWRKTAFGQLTRELDAQVYPDGAQIELTPHYHCATLSSFRRACDVAELNEVKLPDNYYEGLERMYSYFVDIVKPDGHIPMFNDSDFYDLHAWLRDGARRFKRKDMLYLATDGKEGAPPDHTSHAFRWAGQYVMRSGWDRDALYLAMDAGPYGFGHQHEDKLTIDVSAYGRNLVLDPGRFTYARGKWRGYFVSTASHSTLLVDGAGQQRRRTPRATWVTDHPLPNRWLSASDFDFAVGGYEDGYGANDDLIHIRKVFFAEDYYWIVHDLLIGRDGYVEEHSASIQFQFASPGGVHDPQSNAVRTSNEDANLLVLPAPGPSLSVSLAEGEQDPPRGWVGWSLHRALKEAATLASFTQEGKVPLSFDTILYPYRGSAPPRIEVERLAVRAGDQILRPTQATALSIQGDGWTDTYFCAHQPPQQISFGDYETDAEVVYVRSAREDEPAKVSRIGGSFVRGGDEVLVEDKTLEMEEASRVDLDGSSIVVNSEAPVRAQVEYGYADGGGFIFATPLTEPTKKTTIALPDIRVGLSYVYRLILVEGERRAVSKQGRIKIPIPSAFNFDDGRLQGWSGSEVLLTSGYDDTAGALRVSAGAMTDVRYIHAQHSVRLTVAPDLRLSFVYRAPFDQGGDWCYIKATLHDRNGDDWSAYFGKKPSDKWRTVELTLDDFRGDTYNKPEQQGKPLPVGIRARRLSFILRKGKTDKAVAPALCLDKIVVK